MKRLLLLCACALGVVACSYTPPESNYEFHKPIDKKHKTIVSSMNGINDQLRARGWRIFVPGAVYSSEDYGNTVMHTVNKNARYSMLSKYSQAGNVLSGKIVDNRNGEEIANFYFMAGTNISENNPFEALAEAMEQNTK